MNKLDQLFLLTPHNLLAVYATAGYPDLNSLATVLPALQEAGADLIEVGMPFSDPVADGDVIQQTSAIALRNGMHMQLMFEQLQQLKVSVLTPIVLMGYINPVLSFGMEKFLQCASSAGVSGIILPDLPPEEYEASYRHLFARYDLHAVFLVTPSTPDARISYIASLSGGFLYAVAEAGVTGSKNTWPASRTEYLKRVKQLAGNLPVLAGFGIHNHQMFTAVCEVTNGAITGSAFLRALGKGDDIQTTIHAFVKQLTGSFNDSSIEK
ncbi:MAG: tryptophan synthase subunit alpha [Bacteroidetes bacterium]|nr:tryptophan synthase subunit alpha [Bacteroidota bacterium]